MKWSAFLKDRVMILILQVFCMLALCGYLLLLGNTLGETLLIILVWILILAVYLGKTYWNRKQYFGRLLSTARSLEQAYLITEVMERPAQEEDRQYYQLLKLADKSMMETITAIRHERREYKEYVEQWVHEIKTPIAAIKLTCENNKSEITRRILTEVEKTDNYVEQALFYARSENVENDYLIKQVSLKDCVHGSVVHNKRLMIQNGVGMDLGNLDYLVLTDSKWVEFILNQLLVNAVKYRREEAPVIRINARAFGNQVELAIEDNGIGIVESDLPRIFEKGFTGNNGRNDGQHSTGIGLYLCKRLCDKMGIGIQVLSEQGKYTRFLLRFPRA